MNQLRDVLNRLRWDPGRVEAGIQIVVLVRRGGSETREGIPFEDVVEIGSRGVVLGDGTFLPFHRIREVRRGGDELWRRPPRPRAGRRIG